MIRTVLWEAFGVCITSILTDIPILSYSLFKHFSFLLERSRSTTVIFQEDFKKTEHPGSGKFLRLFGFSKTYLLHFPFARKIFKAIFWGKSPFGLEWLRAYVLVPFPVLKPPGLGKRPQPHRLKPQGRIPAR